MSRRLWRQANLRLVPSALICIGGATVNNLYGGVRSDNTGHKLIAVAGVVVFIGGAVTFLNVFTGAIRRLMTAHYLGTSRAAVIQFVLRTIGYIVIVLATLDLLGISTEKLLVGGAAVSIILGVAAQQALANFFASIVLVVAHPFVVGDEITLNSGALGGAYDGKIIDIGLTHTKLLDSQDNVVLLPNATILSGAAIRSRKRKPAS